MSVANPHHPYFCEDQDTDEPAVLIFAKAPEAGRCKTRLARGCHPRRAARIYRALLEHAVASVRARAPRARISLICAPSPRHPFFQHLARDYDLTLRRQTCGDLGQRMHAAIRAALGQHRMALLIGSDQPALAGSWLTAARKILARDCRVWLAPTTDGGYWAIGLTRPAARLFRGPVWSSTRVARKTRRNAARCRLDIACWPAQTDIDTWRDWCTLEPGLRGYIARRATGSGIGPSNHAAQHSHRRRAVAADPGCECYPPEKSQ